MAGDRPEGLEAFDLVSFEGVLAIMGLLAIGPNGVEHAPCLVHDSHPE
jgi:hypothetical protein